MKGVLPHLTVTLAAGALGAGLVAVLPLNEAARAPALWGVLTAAAVGVVALLLKARLDGKAAVKALVRVQGVVFGLRMLAVGAGAVALKQLGRDPVPFVVAFFCVYLVQQVVEVRYILAAQRGGNEVSR